jgi:hypothetical protein
MPNIIVMPFAASMPVNPASKPLHELAVHARPAGHDFPCPVCAACSM